MLLCMTGLIQKDNPRRVLSGFVAEEVLTMTCSQLWLGQPTPVDLIGTGSGTECQFLMTQRSTPTLKRGFSGVNHLLCGHLLLLPVKAEEEATCGRRMTGHCNAAMLILFSKTFQNTPTTKLTIADYSRC